ncbi:MAG TPA: PAS domain-containing protein [Rhabdochlamydiaceae bacterium]|nr:PAS domain-containing protein [Rhabdochlamydiaceae bacterium]
MILGEKRKTLLHEAAENFWALMEMNVVPIITWTFDGKVTTANDAFLELIGYSRDDFEKRKVSWKDITPSEYHHLDERCISELHSERIAPPYEKEFIRKDKKKVKVRLHNATHDLGVSRKGVAIIIGLD